MIYERFLENLIYPIIATCIVVRQAIDIKFTIDIDTWGLILILGA